MSKTSKGRCFAEQFLLFLGMAALAFFIGKELVDSLGASHPATWTAVVVMVVLILLPFLNEIFGWSRNLRLRNQLERARQRVAEKNFNGLRIEFFADKVDIYAQKVQGERGELLRSAPISARMRVEYTDENLLCFSQDLPKMFCDRFKPCGASGCRSLAGICEQRFYFHDEQAAQTAAK